MAFDLETLGAVGWVAAIGLGWRWFQLQPRAPGAALFSVGGAPFIVFRESGLIAETSPRGRLTAAARWLDGHVVVLV